MRRPQCAKMMNRNAPNSTAHQVIESQKSQLLSVMVGVYARRLTGTLRNHVQAGSKIQVCSPHWHLNIRMVRPLFESNIVPTSWGSAPQRVQDPFFLVSEPVICFVLIKFMAHLSWEKSFF